MKCLSKEEIKPKLLDSITLGEVLECEDLNKEAEEVQDLEKTADIIKWYEDIIFRINVFKLCKKHPKLLKSSIGLGFFKNYHKDIKAICEEYEKDF